MFRQMRYQGGIAGILEHDHVLRVQTYGSTLLMFREKVLHEVYNGRVRVMTFLGEKIRHTSVLASDTLQRYCNVISENCNVFFNLKERIFPLSNNVIFRFKITPVLLPLTQGFREQTRAIYLTEILLN